MASDHVHTTIELTTDPAPFSRLKKRRSQARKTAISLRQLRGDKGRFSVIAKHDKKISNCSIFGAFRQVTPGQNHKIGQALCKSKLCPICQSVLSSKRKNNALDFFELNKSQLKKYNFQHFVLTVKHDKYTRNGLYASEIVDYFRKLRGNKNKHYAADWNKHVFGGSYSVEITSGKNGSPHIHIHSLLITHEKIDHRHDFFQRLKTRWKSITSDSTNLRIEPVFYFDKDRKRVNYDPEKDNVQCLARAFSECIKYTMKTNDYTFKALGKRFIEDLLSTRIRLYSRFGALYNHKNNNSGLKGLERLATDFKDLKDVESTDNELVNLKTGEVVDLKDTRIIVTAFKNVVPKKIKNKIYYKVIDNLQIRHFAHDDVKGVATDMNTTLTNIYQKINDI